MKLETSGRSAPARPGPIWRDNKQSDTENLGCRPGFIEYGKPGRRQDVTSSLDFLGRGLSTEGREPLPPRMGCRVSIWGHWRGLLERGWTKGWRMPLGRGLWGGSSPGLGAGPHCSGCLGPWTSVCSGGHSLSLEHWKTSRVGSLPRLRLQGVGPSAGERGLPPVSRGCCLLSGEAWDLKGGLTVAESQEQRWRNLAAGTPQCSEKLRSPPVRKLHGRSQSCFQQMESGPNWAAAAIGVSRPNGSS